jgi:hypothetical protein
MRKKVLTIVALIVFMGAVPALAQEEPSTPAPSTEQQPAQTDATKKAEPAAHPKRIRHHRHIWPWNWVWYRWRYMLHHRHHRM